MIQSLFDTLPNYLHYIGTFFIFLLFVEFGYLIGKRKENKSDDKAGENIGRGTTSILGLFAFLIAFVFSITAGRVDARKQNVTLEANAIATAYLRADFLNDPYKSNIKNLLRDYVDLRLETATKMTSYKDTKYFIKAEEIHDLLWTEAMLGFKDVNNGTIVLMSNALNEVFDMHSKRVAASIYNRISGNTWIMLYTVGILGMLMIGIQNGISARRRYLGIIPMILAFTIIFIMIEDLNNPQRGLFKISQQPLIDVQKSISK